VLRRPDYYVCGLDFNKQQLHIVSNTQFLFDTVVLAQHGGVRYDNTSYTAYLIIAEYCNIAVLYTADNYSRHFIRSFPSNNMFAVNRCVVTLQFRLVPRTMVHVEWCSGELTKRPQVAASWHAQSVCRIADNSNSWLR